MRAPALIAMARMLWFHVRQYGRVAYFVRQMVAAVVSAALLQYLAARGSGSIPDGSAWVRSGQVGLWVSCTSAAGIIGFQRYQGTLSALVSGARTPGVVLVPLISSIASFGLLAFPLSALISALLGEPVGVEHWPTAVLGIAISWAGGVLVSLVVAPIFVLSPHATTYEVLLVAPMMLLTGVFGYPEWSVPAAASLGLLVPLTVGVDITSRGAAGTSAFATVTTPSLVVVWLAVALAWLLLAHALLRLCLRRARVDGSLDVI